MTEFNVALSSSSNMFEVIKLTWNTPASFRGEILYKSDSFETANTVCDQLILDADPAYQAWLEQQDSAFA